MMQFNIQGQLLELAEGFSLQFTKKNPLFAFDDVECERSVSFDIPATPNNDRIFSLSRWAQAYGAGMRRRYDAQMQNGFVVKSGYLYISSYENGKYKAVFITGELLGLQRLRDAGKIAQIIDPTEIVQWSLFPFTPANSRTQAYAQVKYQTKLEAPYPSARLRAIITQTMQALGVPCTLPSIIDYIRYIPAELSGLTEQNANYIATIAPMSTGNDYPICYTGSLGQLDSVFSPNDARVQRWIGVPATTIYRGKFRQLRARQNIEIIFPNNWDDDLFIGYFVDGDSNLLTEFQFYGDRSFDEQGNVTGESLRGRSIEIERDAYFAIIDKSSYVYMQTSSGLTQGWSPVAVNCEFTIKGGEIDLYSYIRLADNLPDLTVTELLKTVAAISGRQLYYTEADGVTFDTLQFGSWDVYDLSGKVLSSDNCTRKFGDYAQTNVVQYDSADEVADIQRILVEYTIDNDSLEAEKELQKVPFSEGKVASIENDLQLLETNAANTLADAAANTSMMTRVRLNKNAGVQSLCTASTSVTIKARLTQHEYERLMPKTRIYYAGAYYVWTEAQYSKNVVTLKLAKISA